MCLDGFDYKEIYEHVRYIAESLSKKEEKDNKKKLESVITTNKANMVKEMYSLWKFNLSDSQLIELSEYLDNINKFYK